mmetsp:Transcript_6473/g.18092  ORF Transcript_6473/g.18092 Transcript_6473/m.18092 type:complete len:186 (-) Transcript_6473:522-1079(-)
MASSGKRISGCSVAGDSVVDLEVRRCSDGLVHEVPESVTETSAPHVDSREEKRNVRAARELGRYPIKKRITRGFGGSAAPTGRTEPVKQVVPGPGDYHVKDIRSTRNFAMPRASRTKHSTWLEAGRSTVGPGMYDIKPLVGSGPKYQIAPKRKSFKDNGVPGPGAYDGLEHTIASALERHAALYD